MTDTLRRIKESLKDAGCECRTVSIEHLSELLDSITALVDNGDLDKELYAAYGRYFTESNINLPGALTIFIIAMPQAMMRVKFTHDGKSYYGDVPPTYIWQNDDPRASEIMNRELSPQNYHVTRARLPLKTLAVRSGLATYGKNNISYIPGTGSFYRLIAFYSDCPCEEDNWQEPKIMKACQKCNLCQQGCPTKCITPDERFLIHAEKCLTFFNESEKDFPDWIKPEWHNTLIGCMRCQLVCPVNEHFLNNTVNGPSFSEEETNLILNNTVWDKLKLDTRTKLESIAYKDDYILLPRNLRVLINKQNKCLQS